MFDSGVFCIVSTSSTLNSSGHWPDDEPVVIRVQVQEDVFFVERNALFEEDDGLRYKGMGQWNASMEQAVPLDRIVQAQKDLRLFVRLPSESSSIVQLCDLTELQVNTDPFGIFECRDAAQETVWEYLPWTQKLKQVELSDVQFQNWHSTFELALFG